MKPNISIGPKDRAAVVKILAALLADEYVLYTQARNCHWNVTGGRFHDLHKFFEAHYEELNDMIDEVAERIRTVGSPSPGTLGAFLEATRLKEADLATAPADRMTKTLLANHEAIIRQLRGDLERCASRYHDMGTSDFLTGLMEHHEKMSWMLRATIT